MTPQELSDGVVRALAALVQRGEVRLAGELPESVLVERPPAHSQGDYATNVALQLAAGVGEQPRALARLLADELIGVDGVAAVEVTGPGFVNVTVDPVQQGAVAVQVVEAGPAYGSTSGVLQDSGRPDGRATADVASVQYAHARTASLLRNGVDLGLTADGADPGLLTSQRAGDLLRALAEFPRVVATADRRRDPSILVRHLQDTAETFHRFSGACRVLPQGDEEPSGLHRARLLLVAATRVVLANGLGLLGVTAPERM